MDSIIYLERYQNLIVDIRNILTKNNQEEDVIKEILYVIQEYTKIEAVAIRLRNEQDFPYYEVRGFSREFVAAENSLCSLDENGNVIKDSIGNPVLECMCGNIIEGRFNPELHFFTKGGSFWTNSTTELLASISEKDRQSRTRNRCNGEGYESVALIPIVHSGKKIGLLQLNDREKNKFSFIFIKFLEIVAYDIGFAVILKEKQQEMTKRIDDLNDFVVRKDFETKKLKQKINELSQKLEIE